MNASKYLVATKETQGKRSNDFSSSDEGHIAIFGSVCDGGRVDDKCGCKRSMVTPSNAKATTTVKVVELSEDDIATAYAEIIKHYVEGWGIEKAEAIKMATAEMTQNNKISNSFVTGSVLEIRGNKVASRV